MLPKALFSSFMGLLALRESFLLVNLVLVRFGDYTFMAYKFNFPKVRSQGIEEIVVVYGDLSE